MGVLYILLQSSYVQTTLVKYITQRIEETTGVKIQIGGVDFRPVSSLLLEDVLVKDFKEDTLLYCQRLKVKADSFNFVDRTFTIREITLDRATFNLWVSDDGTNATNIEMLIDSLQKEQTPTLPPQPQLRADKDWLIGLQKVSLRNSRFTYREEVFEPVDYGVNWTDVDCRDLNVDITGLNFSESPMRVDIAGLSFVEKSGLVVKNMSGKVKAGSSNLLVTDCHFEFERSNVELIKLEFNWTPNQHDWKYFTTRMQQYYELGPSAVSFIDLAYFNGVLRGITNTVKCSGIVSNTIEQLEGHDLYFELGDKTVFQGSFKSVGLPDVWNTVFNIELHKAHMAPEDLATVYLPWFDMNIPVPSPLYRLPYVNFERITFDGTLSDFIVKARSITPDLSGDLSFIYGPCQPDTEDCASMWGDYHFDAINFRTFTGLSMLGMGTLSGSYAGIWNDEGPFLHSDAKLQRLSVNQSAIRGTDLTMDLIKDQFQLEALVDDRLMQAHADLTYDLSDTLDAMQMNGMLRLHDLGALGLGLSDSTEKAEVTFDLTHREQQEKSFTVLTLDDIKYENNCGEFSIRNLVVEDRGGKEENTTTLRSDILDLDIAGNYREVRPFPFIVSLMQNYLPAYSVHRNPKAARKKKEDLKQFNFEYTVDVKDADRVLRVLWPGVSISSGTKLTSWFRRGEKGLQLNLQSDTIRYHDIKLIGSRLNMTGNPERLNMKYTSDRVVYGDGYQLYNITNRLTLADNHLDNRLSWSNWETQTYSGELSACVIFAEDEKNNYSTEVRIHPGVIVMNDSVWKVNKSTIFISGKEATVDNFSIRRGNEYLSVNGKVSEDPAEKLVVHLHNFNIENIARIALKRHLALFGITSGELTLQDYYKDFLLLSDFNIENWGLNRDTLGSLRLRSYWDAENRSLIVGAQNRVQDEIPLSVSGYYNPATDTLNVSMRLKKVGLERVGWYASDYVSQTEGFLSGNVDITGTLQQPDISGFVYLDSVGMKVNMLNTKFFVHDSIHIVKNRFLFNHFLLRDRHNQQAVLDGEYQIWQNRYRLNATFENFQLLNTGFADNESFYGQMYLSGLAELNNANGLINVTVNARTENDSRLYIPLTAALTEQDNNFLHFITPGQNKNRKLQSPYMQSDINLNANLEVNDHLNVQVIFDPTVGDILRTTGSGDIKIDFDKDGSLNMFGEYRITRGDYLFTLSNLVNKKFVLTPGGTINWSGSPYDAMLNINAVYNLKTTITELLPAGDANESGIGEQASESGRKVPVECILNLSENLTNPTVKFDINFPTLETQSRSYIQSLFSSQDEINKQMFSLLVLNRFYRTDNSGDYGLQAQTAGVTTVTEMMSNQLSRWLSQISNNVDIGVAYRMGDPDREISSDEIEVALSTQLLNDRVTISANGNMDVGGTKNGTADSKKTNIAGDFDVEVKLNKQGTLKMKAYSHTDEKLLYNNTETIQGVGVSYQESFDTLKELLRKYFGFLKRKKGRERGREER